MPRDIGNDHLPMTIGMLEFSEAVGDRWLHTGVIDADLFCHRHIVVDRHLSIADNGQTPDLTGVEPANVDLGPNSSLEFQLDVCNVMNSGLDTRTSTSADHHWRTLQHM